MEIIIKTITNWNEVIHIITVPVNYSILFLNNNISHTGSHHIINKRKHIID